MRKFTFKLNGLLLLGEMRESEAATALRESISVQLRHEASLSLARNKMDEARARIERSASSSVDVFSHVGALADLDNKAAIVNAAELELKKQLKKVESARSVWTIAATELKIVQKLKAKAASSHLREANYKEQLELDEAGSRLSRILASF